MKVTVYSAHAFEQPYLEHANNQLYDLNYIHQPLSLETVHLAHGCEAVSIFVSDDASAPILDALNDLGVNYLALRSAGFNNVDLEEAKRKKIRVARVPEYSPYAVAEHAIALMLALNRKLIHSRSRLLEQNFSLDGLTGFDMNNKTAGIIGTGKIGAVMAKILHGFGCKILAFDINPNENLKKLYQVEYTTLDSLYAGSDIVSLHVPLTSETKYMINTTSLNKMKPGVMLINTSRGRLLHTKDVIQALKSGKIGYLGLDVYEEEEGLFFEDHSEEILQDDTIARLMTFKNVLITGHQAFLTGTALQNIAETTIYNLNCFAAKTPCKNEL
ncbi:MAG TPA: 2-hydroxyacid dehydrogenase [Bacteroidia bacterium]|jgi:D-lactate dehydrogenase|nr:2-hydroxyacid dehydrogenase [Bacteroidia bacterium]